MSDTDKFDPTSGDKSETDALRLKEDGYVAVPNEGVNQEAFYARSLEELERLFRERNLQPSDFLVELASMSCHPVVYQESEHADDLDEITEQIGELFKKASEESGVQFGFGTPLKIDPSWSESETQQQIEAHRQKFLKSMGLRLVEPKKENQ